MNKYKKFTIAEVLQWQGQIEIDPLQIKKLSIQGKNYYPFYGQSTLNNGVISYLCLQEQYLNNKEGKPTILVHSNNQNVVYLESPFYLKDGHGATSVLQCEKLNSNNALFIISCIKKVISEKFTYDEKATKIALKNTTIDLPVDENEDIDFIYMEKYINKLKEEKIANVKSFLESEINDNIDSFNPEKFKVEYKDFKVGSLFDIHPTKTKTISAKAGKTPVLSNTAINNGINKYVEDMPTEKGGIITFSDTTESEKTVFYQPDDFIGFSHVQGMYPYSKRWNKKSLLYFVAAFKKSIGNTYDYATKFNRNNARNLLVKLPVTSMGELDFDYMEKYISYLERKIINDTILTI